MRPTINQFQKQIQNLSLMKENKLTKRFNLMFGDNIAKREIIRNFSVIRFFFHQEHYKCDFLYKKIQMIQNTPL